MKKPEIGSKVVYVRPTAKEKNTAVLSIPIGTVCTVEHYLRDNKGIDASCNKDYNRVILFWDEFRELTLLEKELYED